MMQSVPTVNLANDLTQIALSMQADRTGHAPTAVTVVANDTTIVFTFQEALTPAEKILAQTESGAAKVEQYHRALFAVSCSELRKEIGRLTGRRVREAAVALEPATGALVHAFASGTIVHIFELEPSGGATDQHVG